jgi:hypothetical protein
MNLQAKSAASPCCVYGYSYQYMSDDVFEVGCRQRTTATWVADGCAIVAAGPYSAVPAAMILAGMKLLSGMLG